MDPKTLKPLIYLNFCTSAHCMIVYLALSISLSYLFSQTIFVFSFFTGLYLMAMGLGVYIVERKVQPQAQMSQCILINSLLGIIVANPLIYRLSYLGKICKYLILNE